jgi:hypothetical protein
VAKYILTKPYYKAGVLYLAGDIIEVPDSDKPSKNWLPVPGQSVQAAEEEKPRRGRPPGPRPADTDPAA